MLLKFIKAYQNHVKCYVQWRLKPSDYYLGAGIVGGVHYIPTLSFPWTVYRELKEQELWREAAKTAKSKDCNFKYTNGPSRWTNTNSRAHYLLLTNNKGN